jgi:ATP-dependent DNA ligase
MEAELVDELPAVGEWQYEPKWDGFRGILENIDGKLARSCATSRSSRS